LLPVIAIWTEDSAGHVVDNLFVPSNALVPENTEEDIEDVIAEGELEEIKFDPSVLPVFNSRINSVKANFEGPTPSDNFVLHTKAKLLPATMVVVELSSMQNHSLYKLKTDSQVRAFKIPLVEGAGGISILLETE
jgi:hypothetical protein